MSFSCQNYSNKSKKAKVANQGEVVKSFLPLLMDELAMDYHFTEVLFRLNSSDDDFNFILHAIKTTMRTLDHFIFD